jgi:hypothetical protein
MKKIEERVNVSDSKIRGVVVFKRQDGTIVLKKENAIVQNGRKFIRDKFIASGITSLSSFDSNLSTYELDKIVFGSSDVATEYNMTSLVAQDADSVVTISTTPGSVEAEDSAMFIKFSAEMDRTNKSNGFTVREIGLVIKDTRETGAGPDLLFSRAVFDPITVAPGEKYQVEYYIYF